MMAATWIILLYCITTSIAETCNEYYCRDKQGSGSQPDWQKNLDPLTPINEISVPGTHDTMADEVKDQNFIQSSWTITQSLPLPDQLEAGIRVLDIRITPYPYAAAVGDVTELRIHHGGLHLKTNFYNVLDECTSFLKQYDTEFILMRVVPEGPDRWREYTGAEWQTLLLNVVNKFDSSYFYQKDINDGMPTVDEVRGQIVLFQQYMGDSLRSGFFNYWSHNIIQDTGGGDVDKLKDKIREQLQEAEKNSAAVPSDEFYINFISGNGAPGATPADIAGGFGVPGWCPWCVTQISGTNELTYDWIRDEDPDFVGIIMMDFPGQELIDEIIALNPIYDAGSPDAEAVMSCGSFNGGWSEYYKTAERTLTKSYFRGIRSDSNNRDREFKIDFCSISGVSYSSESPSTLTRTTRREDFKRECSNQNAAITAYKSYWSGTKVDRNWDITCRTLPSGYYLTSCSWSGWINDGDDDDFDWDCSSQKIISGIETDWNKSKNDRKFKFKCCTVMEQNSAKTGLLSFDYFNEISVESGTYSSLFAEYIIYIIIGLLIVNIICFAVYCCSKQDGNKLHKYDPVSLDSCSDIENSQD